MSLPTGRADRRISKSAIAENVSARGTPKHLDEQAPPALPIALRASPQR